MAGMTIFFESESSFSRLSWISAQSLSRGTFSSPPAGHRRKEKGKRKGFFNLHEKRVIVFTPLVHPPSLLLFCLALTLLLRCLQDVQALPGEGEVKGRGEGGGELPLGEHDPEGQRAELQVVEEEVLQAGKGQPPVFPVPEHLGESCSGRKRKEFGKAEKKGNSSSILAPMRSLSI
jgi:hypothetical protein